MSTYMYLVCLDHDPPIRADAESGQHHYDLPRIREEIANRADVVAWNDDEDTFKWHRDDITELDAGLYFRERSAWFLRLHPHCRLGIVDEYGGRHDTDAEDERAPQIPNPYKETPR